MIERQAGELACHVGVALDDGDFVLGECLGKQARSAAEVRGANPRS
jgi:hypothetical protein